MNFTHAQSAGRQGRLAARWVAIALALACATAGIVAAHAQPTERVKRAPAAASAAAAPATRPEKARAPSFIDQLIGSFRLMPNVVGQPLGQARMTLLGAGLREVQTVVAPSTQARGVVTQQSPDPGPLLLRSPQVVLTVSRVTGAVAYRVWRDGVSVGWISDWGQATLTATDTAPCQNAYYTVVALSDNPSADGSKEVPHMM